jgi:hypothetical protein
VTDAPTQTDQPTDTPAERANNRNQLLAAIVLGLAATLTAFASYQSGKAGGDASTARADAARSLADANYFYGQANQTFAGDQALFIQYASAAQEGNADLATYLTTLMRPELDAAVTWWQESGDEILTPFDEAEDNPYTLADQDEAQRLEKVSNGQLKAAEDADEKGDTFDLATVLLALTLFFAGIATLFGRNAVTIALLVISAVTLVAGTTTLITGL